MATKKNIEKELEQRLVGLDKKYEHEQQQLKLRYEKEKRVIEERYKHMLKSFDRKPPKPLH